MTPADNMLANCVRQLQDVGWQMSQRVDGGMQAVQADPDWWKSKIEKAFLVLGMLDEMISE